MAHRPAAADRDRGACRNRRGGWICRGDMGRAHPAGMVRPSVERPPMELTSDWRLAVFTLSVAFLVCLIAGLIPRCATNPGRLATSRQVGGGRHRRLLDRCLVAAQVGLSLVLLVAATVRPHPSRTCGREDPGYSRENVLMFSVDAPARRKDRPCPADNLPGRPRFAADAARCAEPPRCRRCGR